MKLTFSTFFSTLVLLTLMNCTTDKERIDFYVNTKGLNEFSITYGISCADEVIVLDGRLQCTIPSNGILLVPHEYIELPLDYRFFAISRSGKEYRRIPINYHRESDGQPIPGIRIQGLSPLTIENAEKKNGISFKYLRSQEEEKYQELAYYEKIDLMKIKEIEKCFSIAKSKNKSVN